MKIAVHRILFGIAAFFMFVSVISFLLFLNWFEIPINGNVLFTMLGFFHVALLVLPIFLYRVRIIGLLSLALLFLTQFLYHMVRFFRYFSDFPISDILDYTVFPMFMIPNFDLNFIRFDPWLASSNYTRFIGVIIAIVATVLSLKASKVAEPMQGHVSPEIREPQLFVPGANPKKMTSAVTTTESIEQVERLGALLSKGLITKDEFEIKKKEILGL
jgi:phosphoglycerol transferase MdoB-like AlkP superfamily enzyme